MTGHTCPSCGAEVPCDKRNMGTGRQKPLTSYNNNHQSIHAVLEKNPGHWFTVLDVFMLLKQGTEPRRGRRAYWLDSDAQNALSDIVGWGYAEMQRVPKSRRFMYRFKAGRST